MILYCICDSVSKTPVGGGGGGGGWGGSTNISVKVSRWGVENLALIRTKKFLKYIPYNSGNKSRGIYFSKTLFEGLIFRGAYVRREICVSKSIRLAYSWKEIYRFLLCFTLYLRLISKYKPPGGLYSEGRFHGRLFMLSLGGLYIEGLIFGILRIRYPV